MGARTLARQSAGPSGIRTAFKSGGGYLGSSDPMVEYQWSAMNL